MSIHHGALRIYINGALVDSVTNVCYSHAPQASIDMAARMREAARRPMAMCEHANEARPYGGCRCPLDCACRETMCHVSDEPRPASKDADETPNRRAISLGRMP